MLSCVGNRATVVTGDAKGGQGTVIGKHGGIEHVLIDFPSELMEQLIIGDRVLVKSFGVGLKLLDCPNIKLLNMDPALLEAWAP